MSWLPAEFEALQEAARLGHLERTRELLDGGADPNTHPGMPRGWSPLMYAAHEGHLDVVRLLLDCGADVNFACGDFFTALTLAAGAAHWEVVKLLAERGGDLAHVDASGVSGLGAAERTGDAELVASLREIVARPPGADTGHIQDN
jgi:ankyrin repeat protein